MTEQSLSQRVAQITAANAEAQRRNDRALRKLNELSLAAEDGARSGSRPPPITELAAATRIALSQFCESASACGAAPQVLAAAAPAAERLTAATEQLELFLKFGYHAPDDPVWSKPACFNRSLAKFREAVAGRGAASEQRGSVEELIARVHKLVDTAFARHLELLTRSAVTLDGREIGIHRLSGGGRAGFLYIGEDPDRAMAGPVGQIVKAMMTYAERPPPQLLPGSRFSNSNTLVTDRGFSCSVIIGAHVPRISGVLMGDSKAVRMRWEVNETVDNGRFRGYGRAALCRQLFNEVSFAHELDPPKQSAERRCPIETAPETAAFLAFVSENLRDIDLGSEPPPPAEYLKVFRKWYRRVTGKRSELG